MFRKNLDTFVIALIFIGVTKLLGILHFWQAIGLEEPSGFIFQGLIFLALVVVMRHTLFQPYSEIAEERDRQISGKKKQAEERRLQAQEMLKSYEQKILSARMEALKQKEHIAMEAENEERKKLEDAKLKSQQNLDAAKKEIFSEVETAKKELINSTNSLVQQLVDEVLSQKISKTPGSSKSKTVETRM